MVTTNNNPNPKTLGKTQPDLYPAKPQISVRNQRLLHRSKHLDSKREISHPIGNKNVCVYFKILSIHHIG